VEVGAKVVGPSEPATLAAALQSHFLPHDIPVALVVQSHVADEQPLPLLFVPCPALRCGVSVTLCFSPPLSAP
jgi:hypothetical protein